MIQYRVATVPNEANTHPERANIGLFSVVNRVPKMTMRAGERMSAIVPLTLFEKLQRNWATACRLPIYSRSKFMSAQKLGGREALAYVTASL